MKKIILLTMLLSFSCYAQTESDTKRVSIFNRKHEVKIGAIKLLGGPILEGAYEYIASDNITFGSYALINFQRSGGYYENFSVTPFARFYFSESEKQYAKGFFIEGFVKYINFTYDEYEHYYRGVDGYYQWEEFKPKTTYNAIGAGGSVGWKWINRKGIVLEIFLGSTRRFLELKHLSNTVFHGDVNIGYRF